MRRRHLTSGRVGDRTRHSGPTHDGRAPGAGASRNSDRRRREEGEVVGSWTKALLTLLVVWAVGVTAATQNSRATRQPTRQAGQFREVAGASGAVVAGDPATNPGHPVANATVYLVPVAAIDTTTRITASAVYAPPHAAEAIDEPLEDAIRLRGTASRRPPPTLPPRHMARCTHGLHGVGVDRWRRERVVGGAVAAVRAG